MMLMKIVSYKIGQAQPPRVPLLFAEEEERAAGKTSKEELKGAALMLQLADLKLDNVDAMEPLQLNVQVILTPAAVDPRMQLTQDYFSAFWASSYVVWKHKNVP